jgi:hypothetical protein
MSKILRHATWLQVENSHRKRVEKQARKKFRERNSITLAKQGLNTGTLADALGLAAGVCTDPVILSVAGHGAVAAPCRRCKACLLDRRNAVIGGALAEAATSSCVIDMTLTYEDEVGPHGLRITPPGAERLDLEHVQAFKDKLKRKYNMTLLYAGEYGSENGRAHWHVILYFKGDPEQTRRYAEDFVKGYGFSLDFDWLDTVPPVEVKRRRMTREELKPKLADPGLLLLEPGNSDPWSQQWEYWPYGSVAARLIRDGLASDLTDVLRSTLYASKYLYVCPWMDSKKWASAAWEELPEWVRQTAIYHKDGEGRWQFGNDYRKHLDEVDTEDVYQLARYKSPNGGLGAEYFRCLARFHAKQGDDYYGRKYRINGMNKPARHDELTRRFKRGIVNLGRMSETDEWRFHMSDTQYKTYMTEWIAERERLTGKRILPRDQCPVYVNIVRKALMDSVRGKGKFVYDLVEKQGHGIIRQMEIQMADMPNYDVKKLAGKPQYDLWLENSLEPGWAEKRERRNRLRDEGRDVLRFVCFDQVITKSAKGVWRLEETDGITGGRLSVVLNTRAELASAFRGRFNVMRKEAAPKPLKRIRAEKVRDLAEKNGWEEVDLRPNRKRTRTRKKSA